MPTVCFWDDAVTRHRRAQKNSSVLRDLAEGLAFTVLFRPLPIEASSGVAAASALEGVFLMGLVWVSRRRLRSIFRCMRNQPYVAYCVGIMLTFIYAFSAFSNFGILARQRCQVLPFFLALLCLPVWKREGVITTEAALEGRDEEPVESAPAPGAPYPDAAQPTASEDPYAKADFGFDPYERFRDPSTRHPTDHV